MEKDEVKIEGDGEKELRMMIHDVGKQVNCHPMFKHV